MNIDYDLLQYYQFKKLIRKKDEEQILSESKRLNTTARDYMLTKEMVSETSELEALAEYYSMPCVEIDMLDMDENLVNLFSFELMKKHKVVPVFIDKNGVLLVAVGKPLDCNAMSVISTCYTGMMDYILVPPVQIDRYIDSVAAVISTSNALSDLNSAKDEKLFGEKEDTSVIYKDDEVINNPSVRLVDSIIKEAIPYRASDIHIEPFDKKVRVRYRIDGDLQDRAEFPSESYSAISARIKIMAGMNIAERRAPQDGRINLIIGGKEYDFRVSTLPTIHGEKFVIRILDKSSFHFTRSDLGFTEAENKIVDRMLMRPHGIVLLTGPTGCGKTTTLYSFLKEINKSTVNVVTVEDPVEYTLNGVNQTQVNTLANMTFATALRSILRQDPDIIMIGEIRDDETAAIAVRAAITGHLVFSTLHTNDAPGAVTRLEDMGVPDYLVADSLAGVIAQRLVKRLCPMCKKRGKTNPKEMEILGLTEPVTIARPQGCQFCNNTGYKGRTAVHEILYVNEKMQGIISREKNVEKLRDYAKENGMRQLWESCKTLVLNGTTSIQEIMTLNA